MNLKTEKLDIIEQIILVQDENLLQAVKSLLEFGLKHQQPAPAEDFWDSLSEKQKQRVDQSIQELEAGMGIPHEEVMSRFRKKYSASI